MLSAQSTSLVIHSLLITRAENDMQSFWHIRSNMAFQLVIDSPPGRQTGYNSVSAFKLKIDTRFYLCTCSFFVMCSCLPMINEDLRPWYLYQSWQLSHLCWQTPAPLDLDKDKQFNRSPKQSVEISSQECAGLRKMKTIKVNSVPKDN